MALVPVPRLEAHIEPTIGGGFRLTMPKRRALFPMLFLPVWLVGWAIGEIAVLRHLLTGSHSGAPPLFMLVWVTGWTLGGGWALATVAWLVAGRERVRVEHGTLTLEQVVFGRRGGLAFDYGTSTIRWGAGLDEAEAGVVVERLGARGVSRALVTRGAL